MLTWSIYSTVHLKNDVFSKVVTSVRRSWDFRFKKPNTILPSLSQLSCLYFLPLFGPVFSFLRYVGLFSGLKFLSNSLSLTHTHTHTHTLYLSVSLSLPYLKLNIILYYFLLVFCVFSISFFISFFLTYRPKWWGH